MCQCFESAPVYGFPRAPAKWQYASRWERSTRLFQQCWVESVILSSAGTLRACYRSWCAEFPFLDSYRVGLAASFRDPGGRSVVIFALGVGLASAFISVPFPRGIAHATI